MQITKLSFKKMTPMVEVWLDNSLGFTCHLDLVLKYQLETGMTLTEDVLESLRQDQLSLEAWHKALRYCLSRTRTVTEVKRYLSSKEVDTDLANSILARLVQDYELDDLKAVIEYDEQNRGRMGRRRIRSDLQRRGVSGSVIDAALGGRDAEDREAEELEAALALARKKIASDRGDDPGKVAMRVIGLLQRKGYSQGLIRKVADTLELKLY
ncbi:regulatory protein RecX [Acidaminobacter sp.]|uniref:regulatory protein RecX n=1 Tax=Acidaminobacter sp. TaxID=1872102 RepID=UPI0025644D1A|nr:RecX family transcriptional regulator [Acidaminobacter sp.]MDK9709932.1 RecX family transcriptional regulator [Acidaminobacter sp.]